MGFRLLARSKVRVSRRQFGLSDWVISAACLDCNSSDMKSIGKELSMKTGNPKLQKSCHVPRLHLRPLAPIRGHS